MKVKGVGSIEQGLDGFGKINNINKSGFGVSIIF